jgi:hypothetical protein
MSLQPTTSRQVVWPSVVTVISAAILIGAEVFGAAFAGGWALAILFGLDDTEPTSCRECCSRSASSSWWRSCVPPSASSRSSSAARSSDTRKPCAAGAKSITFP